MKILLIVPENSYRIKEFLDAALTLGLEVYIATDSTFAPPDLNDRVFDSIEFCNPESAGNTVNAIVESVGIDTVVAIDEGGIEILEWARALKNGLVEPPEHSLALRDKLLLRSVLKDVVPQPNVFARDFGSIQFGAGIIVKPSKGSASIGVTRVSTIDELKSAVAFIDTHLKQHGVAIIEEYIEGTEHAFEGVVVNGSLVELAIFDKPHPLTGPYFAETIYITPTSLDEYLRKRVLQCVEAAINALEIENGPIHVEVRVANDGTVFIIDFANRSIGGRCSSALSFIGDRTLEVVLLEAITEGDASHAHRENQYSGVYMIPTSESGVLHNVQGIEEAREIPFVTDVVIDAKIGKRYETLHSEGNYMGFIYAKAPTRSLCIEALEKSFNEIVFDIAVDKDHIKQLNRVDHFSAVER